MIWMTSTKHWCLLAMSLPPTWTSFLIIAQRLKFVLPFYYVKLFVSDRREWISECLQQMFLNNYSKWPHLVCHIGNNYIVLNAPLVMYFITHFNHNVSCRQIYEWDINKHRRKVFLYKKWINAGVYTKTVNLCMNHCVLKYEQVTTFAYLKS